MAREAIIVVLNIYLFGNYKVSQSVLFVTVSLKGCKLSYWHCWPSSPMIESEVLQVLA